MLGLVAHARGSAPASAPGRLARALDSRAALVVVFAVTFATIWYSWAEWNPRPVVHDEMAYVLEAQIMARGHWSLPSPPMPLAWEQPHVLVTPALTSKYFPGHSLALVPGALLGWPALMALVLASITGVLLFALARRVGSGGVALLAWATWLFTPMVMYYGATFFSEATTSACWLAGWYALLRWRESRQRWWLIAVAFFTGWCAITRPLTGVAYAIPIAVVVLRDVIRGMRWRDLSLAFAAGCLVIAILPIWSASTTGDWRLTPQTLYTRMYMPYDVPGFGMVRTPPTHSITPDLVQLNNVYSLVHEHHFPSTLPSAFVDRVQNFSISVWGTTKGVLIVFAMLGLFTLTAETLFAVIASGLLIVTYLLYATPAQWTLYYYEATPAFAYLSAAGMAWAASLVGRPRRAPRGSEYGWRSHRWAVALLAAGLVFTLPGLITLRINHAQHISNRRFLERFGKVLSAVHDDRAVVFVHYAALHNPHVTFVRNVAHPERERIWVVYDRGEVENAKLMAAAPGRTAYLFDEWRARLYSYSPSAR